MDNKAYDKFPLSLVLFCIVVSISIYIVGAYLVAPLGGIFVVLYLLYCLWMEIRVLIVSCRDCYYYGRLCAFGKGKICSLLFKMGAPERFKMKEGIKIEYGILKTKLDPFLCDLSLKLKEKHKEKEIRTCRSGTSVSCALYRRHLCALY